MVSRAERASRSEAEASCYESSCSLKLFEGRSGQFDRNAMLCGVVSAEIDRSEINIDRPLTPKIPYESWGQELFDARTGLGQGVIGGDLYLTFNASQLAESVCDFVDRRPNLAAVDFYEA